MKKSLISFSAVFLAITLLAGCTPSSKDAAGSSSSSGSKTLTTVKIGVVAPFSGDAAAFGEEIQRILDFELDTINAKAKSNGYQFELVYEDGKCNGAESNAAFQKLTDVDGVKFILGGACSSESLPMWPKESRQNWGNTKPLLF